MLNGSQMWILNAPIADVFVGLAKSDIGTGNEIRRLSCWKRGDEGSHRVEDRRQLSLARLDHREIVMDNVEGRRKRQLAANCVGLKGPFRLSQPGALRNFLGREWGSA